MKKIPIILSTIILVLLSVIIFLLIKKDSSVTPIPAESTVPIENKILNTYESKPSPLDKQQTGSQVNQKTTNNVVNSQIAVSPAQSQPAILWSSNSSSIRYQGTPAHDKDFKVSCWECTIVQTDRPTKLIIHFVAHGNGVTGPVQTLEVNNLSMAHILKYFSNPAVQGDTNGFLITQITNDEEPPFAGIGADRSIQIINIKYIDKDGNSISQ